MFRYEDLKPSLPANKVKAVKKLDAALLTVEYHIPPQWVLHLTFTFMPGTTDKEACAEFSAINRQFLRLFPGGYVRILAFTKNGNPHLHVVAIVNQDIRSGFHFENYKRMRELNSLDVLTEEQRLERDLLGRSLNPNPLLQEIWRKLDELIERRRKKMGYERTFAPRCEACPITKNAGAMGGYMKGNAEDTLKRPTPAKEYGKNPRRWEPGKLSRGVRPIAYGGDFPQPLVFYKSKGQIAWGEKVDVILYAIGMVRCHMKNRYGSHWHYSIYDEIMPEIERLHGREKQNWPIDSVRSIAHGVFKNYDEWERCGWPPGMRYQLTVPVWQQHGFASHDDYIFGIISSLPPGPSMPVPEFPIRRRRAKRRAPDCEATATAA